MPIAKSTVEFSVRQDVENVFRRIQLKNLLENFFHDKKMTKHDRIPFSLTFHPRNNPVKAIIFNNFKILQNDPETGAFFFATTADFIQTRQKRRQLSSQKHIDNILEAWYFQMRALAMQNLSFRPKR